MTKVIRAHGFTNELLEWQAWLDVVDLDRTTPEQIAVLEKGHPKAKTSDYYRSLVHQPEVLHQHSAMFNAAMYVPGGLSHAERELADAVASCANGCVYCASVRAQRSKQLIRCNDMIKQVPEDPRITGTNTRGRAIVLFSIDLTMRPGGAHGEDLQPLRDTDLTDVKILDLVHVMVISTWANRLMLNLGEPVSPDMA